MFNGYETEELVEAHIKALIRERDDCLRAGRADRAAAASEQLRRFGYDAGPPQKRAEKRPVGRPRKTEARGG